MSIEMLHSIALEMLKANCTFQGGFKHMQLHYLQHPRHRVITMHKQIMASDGEAKCEFPNSFGIS